MSYKLAVCPSKFCGFECNYDEPISEFDSMRATTAINYRNTCPRCGCLLIIYPSLNRENEVESDIEL